MRTNPKTTDHVFTGFVTQAVYGLVASLLIGAAASAEPTTLIAGGDPAVPSSFTLDFGAEGGVASARIVFTDIAFEVDADEGTARFVSYYQEVEPLLLPGGFSTGNLVIEIVDGSSEGSYNERTGEFQTTEFYAIHFEGDLSAFGLESPVFLPSASNGVVTLDVETGGRISLDWVGDGQLANPSNPEEPLEFSYTCEARAAFAAGPTALVRLALVSEVLNLELPYGVERNLTAKLLAAADLLRVGRDRPAVRILGAFANSVAAMSGRLIDLADADLLIRSAEDVISMLRPVGTKVGERLSPRGQGSRGGRR